MHFHLTTAPGRAIVSVVINVFALCSGYLELDRASMLEDLPPGQPWVVPVMSFLWAAASARAGLWPGAFASIEPQSGGAARAN
jgi:hypothetical protein